MAEWNADDYSRGATLQQRLARKMLMSVPLKGTERILDVGCGDGKITAEIAAQVPEGSVLGVDLSRNMIDFASEHFTQPNLQFDVSNVSELPYREEFDRGRSPSSDGPQPVGALRVAGGTRSVSRRRRPQLSVS